MSAPDIHTCQECGAVTTFSRELIPHRDTCSSYSPVPPLDNVIALTHKEHETLIPADLCNCGAEDGTHLVNCSAWQAV